MSRARHTSPVEGQPKVDDEHVRRRPLPLPPPPLLPLPDDEVAAGQVAVCYSRVVQLRNTGANSARQRRQQQAVAGLALSKRRWR